MECIKLYENTLSEDLCDRLCKLLGDIDNVKVTHNADWRRCFQVALTGDEPIFAQEVAPLLRQTMEKYKSDLPFATAVLHHASRIEAPSVICYKAPTDDNKDLHQFALHADNWNDQSAARQISVIVYLNDVEQGGETEFSHYNVSVKPKKGSILMFPAFWTHPHKGVAPQSQDKYIMVTWFTLDGDGSFYRRIRE
jgi:hypothetical protein